MSKKFRCLLIREDLFLHVRFQHMRSSQAGLTKKIGKGSITDHFPMRLREVYFVITPQTMRSPAFPDGSVFMSSAAA